MYTESVFACRAVYPVDFLLAGFKRDRLLFSFLCMPALPPALSRRPAVPAAPPPAAPCLCRHW